MLIEMLKKLFYILAAFDRIKLLRSEAVTRGVLKGVLRNFTQFTGKHLCQTPIQVFSWEVCGTFKSTFFYRTAPVVASEQTQEISVVHRLAK